MAQSGSETTRPYSRTITGLSGGGGRRSLSSVSTTSLSLSHGTHGINPQDLTKPAVIIELGAVLTKIGLAGELSPRMIIRTEYIDEQLIVQKNLLDGIVDTDKKSFKRLFHFFKHIYFTHLLSVPRERRVVIVESLLCPTHIRRAIATILLEMLDAPSVLFAPSHLMATIPFNTPTALVLDVGWDEAVAMPVVEGIVMLSQFQAFNKGAKAITHRAIELLEKHGKVIDVDGTERPLTSADWGIIEHTRLVEDIITRGLYVAPMDRAGANARGEIVKPVTEGYELPLGHTSLVIPGIVRETACEVLFESPSEDDLGLHEMIHAIVARCPIDLRRQLFSRILVTGGIAVIPGLLQRLKSEIAHLASVRRLKTADEIGFYRFNKEDQMEPWTAWLGGAMYGSLTENLEFRSLSREEWSSTHHLSDACDWVDPFVTVGKTRA